MLIILLQGVFLPSDERRSTLNLGDEWLTLDRPLPGSIDDCIGNVHAGPPAGS